MLKGTTETKAGSNNSRAKANKFSISCSKIAASKSSKRRRQNVKTRHNGSTKAKGMVKEKTGTEIKSRNSVNNIFLMANNKNNIASSMEKKRSMSPKTAQMPRKLKKGSRAEPTCNLRRNNMQER